MATKKAQRGPKPKPKPTIVGTNLARLRRERRLSARALALATPDGMVSPPDVSRIESGETASPGIDKIKALADVMRVSLDAFYVGQVPVTAPAVGLREFLDSGLGGVVTDQEAQELRRAVFPWGAPTMEAWLDSLRAMRSIKAAASGRKDKR